MSEQQMTMKEACAKVKRQVRLLDDNDVQVVGKDGQPKFKLQAISEDEAVSFKDYGTHVVVVTEDGQKFSSEKD